MLQKWYAYIIYLYTYVTSIEKYERKLEMTLDFSKNNGFKMCPAGFSIRPAEFAGEDRRKNACEKCKDFF